MATLNQPQEPFLEEDENEFFPPITQAEIMRGHPNPLFFAHTIGASFSTQGNKVMVFFPDGTTGFVWLN